MNGLIEWLTDISSKDTKVRATLRRSLSFDPGRYAAAFPYVEPFLKQNCSRWQRTVYYLVAGLWAAYGSKEEGDMVSIAKASARQKAASESASTEKRFIALLDADMEQLPHRLRQMLGLLKGQRIDFGDLLKDLLYWNDDEKRSQLAWAREFYRETQPSEEYEDKPNKETLQ